MQYLSEKDLIEQNEKLSEELKLCKADKEFVWSLWRELQNQSPDLTAAMDLIIAREKLKNKERFEEMETNLLTQNREVESLKALLDGKAKEIAELSSRDCHMELEMAHMKEELDAEKADNARKADMLCKAALEYEVIRGKCAQLQGENKSLQNTERDLRSQLSQAVGEVRDKHMLEEAYQCQVEKVQALEGDLSSLGKKMAVLSDECSRSAEKCRGLEYRVGECQRELEAAREECRRELEAAREECRRELEAARETALSKEESITLLKEDVKKCQESWANEISAHAGTDLKLKARTTELEAEIAELKADLHVKDRRIQSQAEAIGELVPQLEELKRERAVEELKRERAVVDLQPERTTGADEEELISYPDEVGKALTRSGSRTKGVVRRRSKRIRCQSTMIPVSLEKRHERGTLLESTEKELFDVKMQLRFKDEELHGLRKLHDQRQRRMRILLREHKLVLKQLKTFMDQDEFPKEKGTRPRRLNSPIKKVSNQSSQISSGEAVLGELNVCKSKCKDLEKKMLSLEEERDTLYAQCARGRTKIMELQGLFQNAKEELEKSAANLEVLTRNQMLERKVSELMKEKDSFSSQVTQLQQQKSMVTLQLQNEKETIETRVSQLEGEITALSSTVSELEYEKRCLGREVTRLQEEKSTLETVVSRERETHEKAVCQLQHSKALLDGVVSQLRHDKGKLEAKVSQLQYEKGVLVARCRAYKEECCKTGEEITQLQSTITEMKHRQLLTTASQPVATPSVSSPHPHSPPVSTTLGTVLVADDTVMDSVSQVTRTPGTQQDPTLSPLLSLSMCSLQSVPAGGTAEATMSDSGPCHQPTYSSRHQHQRTRSDDGTPAKPQHGDPSPAHVTDAIRSGDTLRGGTGAKDGRPTKHLSNQQLRSLQSRLKALADHVTALNGVKQSLSQALDLERTNNEKSKIEVRELTQKLRATKAAMQSVQGELHTTTEAKAELEHKLNDLISQRSKDMAGKTASEWKQIEEEKKHLQERCSALLETSKRLEAELQKCKEEVEFTQSRSVKLDRDLKQKKQLINDLRSKLTQDKESGSRDKQKMQSLSNEVLSITSSLNKCKQQSEALRSQLKQQVGENEKLAQAFKECQQDVTKTLDQLNSCQEEQKKKEQLLAQREAALKRKAEAYLEMESKLNSKERVIQQNFKAFTKLLADELCKESANRTLQKRKTEGDSAEVSDGTHVSARVRDIACAFLNFSDADLDEFLTEANDNLQPAACTESESLLMFKDAVRKFQYESPVTTDMVHIFLKFVRESL